MYRLLKLYTRYLTNYKQFKRYYSRKDQYISTESEDIRLAKIHEVHKHSFLGAFTKNLWRPHNSPTSISSKLRIILTKNVKHSAKKLHKREVIINFADGRCTKRIRGTTKICSDRDSMSINKQKTLREAWKNQTRLITHWSTNGNNMLNCAWI